LKASRSILFYFILVLIGVSVFLGVDHYGATLYGSSEGPLQTPAIEQVDVLLHFLLALAFVISVARLLGGLFKWFKQPAVIGEVIGGILLGPSFLGKVAPHIMNYMIPQSTAPFLNIVAQLGIIIYMFLVGLELDLSVMKKSGHSTLVISHVSIIFPFILGTILSLFIFPLLAPSGVSFTSFALFLGLSVSITAFPVLARMVGDLGIQKTPLGVLTLTCAAIDDVTAWCLLALVVSVVQASLSSAINTFLLTGVYTLFMFFVARPVIKRSVQTLEKRNHITESELAYILIGLVLSSLATELIGIHAIFGAFLLGAITPPESRVAEDLMNRLQDVVRILFLPAFFAFTGMRTQIGLIEGSTDIWICVAITGVAIIGKFGGAFGAAKFSGSNWRDSAAIGALMNTRGLVELIALNIGLDLGVLSPKLFTMLVIMALVTTFIAGPVMGLLLPYYQNQQPATEGTGGA
jgi:Kef-type K+ transport system membrane component KefB